MCRLPNTFPASALSYLARCSSEVDGRRLLISNPLRRQQPKGGTSLFQLAKCRYLRQRHYKSLTPTPDEYDLGAAIDALLTSLSLKLSLQLTAPLGDHSLSSCTSTGRKRHHGCVFFPSPYQRPHIIPVPQIWSMCIVWPFC